MIHSTNNSRCRKQLHVMTLRSNNFLSHPATTNHS